MATGRTLTIDLAKYLWNLMKSNEIFLNAIASAAQEFGATRTYRHDIDFVRDIYEVLVVNYGFPRLEIKESAGTDSLRKVILSFLRGEVESTRHIANNYVTFINDKLQNNPTDEAKMMFCAMYGRSMVDTFGAKYPLVFETDSCGVPFNPAIRSMIYTHYI